MRISARMTMHSTIATIVHEPTLWKVLIGVFVVGARVALDGVLPHGHVSSRGGRSRAK
jgi:hypothetical protein